VNGNGEGQGVGTGSGTNGISGEGFDDVQDTFLTDDYNVTAPPNTSLHQNSSWPTPLGISLETATNSCIISIQASDLYEQCLKYTAVDSMTFVNSCVADIQVG